MVDTNPDALLKETTDDIMNSDMLHPDQKK